MFELLHHNALADTDLLRKNDELGDTFTTAREVDVAFETGDRERGDDFAEFLNGKSYGTAAVSEIADGRFRVLVLITMPITQHVIGCGRDSCCALADCSRSNIWAGEQLFKGRPQAPSDRCCKISISLTCAVPSLDRLHVVLLQSSRNCPGQRRAGVIGIQRPHIGAAKFLLLDVRRFDCYGGRIIVGVEDSGRRIVESGSDSG
jgi:hypothetical protein